MAHSTRSEPENDNVGGQTVDFEAAPAVNATRAADEGNSAGGHTLDFQAGPAMNATQAVAEDAPAGSQTLDFEAAPGVHATHAAAGDPSKAKAFDQTLDSVPGSDDDSDTSGSTSSAAPIKQNGSRYRILRPHAEGGLGKVYVARDLELDREVALKEIKARFASDNEYRGRFLFEGGVTGGLEHPGIVPVYGLGTYVDGRPYYAMRFIRGENFETAIKTFHANRQKGENPSAQALALRELLARFIDVCNAMAYAHSRGVLHRDLKPCNIMLGKYGETLVVDWGLAKLVTEEKIVHSGAQPSSSEAPLRAPSGSTSSATMMGSSIGTPSYMSPELAKGQHNNVGPSTDIFLLGATLYHILAGVAPYHGKSVTEVIEKARKCEWPPISEHWPQIPKPLAAICAKAMAKEADDRYSSAHRLAADLERWLADEPVTAYREPLLKRSIRWAKRHRTLCTSVASALLVTAVALGAWRMQVRATVARLDREARSNLVKGHEAFARSELQAASTFAEKALSTVGTVNALKPIREEAETLKQNATVEIEKKERDAKLTENYQNALSLGAVELTSGDYAEAERQFQAASEVFDHRFEAWTNLAELYRVQEKHDKAVEAANKAVALSDRNDTPYRVRALLYRDISGNERAQKKVGIAAQESRRQAIADFQNAIDAADFGPARAEDHYERGRLLHLEKKYTEALAEYQSATGANPKIAERAQYHQLRAEALFALHRDVEAEEANAKYLELLKLNADDYLKNAFAKQRQGNISDALKEYTLALAINPNAGSAAYARRGWANLNYAAELAREDFQRAIDADANNGELYNGRGYALAVLGDFKGAVKDAEKALELGPADAADVRQAPAITVNAACIYSVASGKARDAGEPAALVEEYRGKAVELLRKVTESQKLAPKSQFLQQTVKDRAFDPIRATPEFQRLLADYP